MALVSVLTSKGDLGVELSLARVWSASVANVGSHRKSCRTMESLRSPLGWMKPNPFSRYLWANKPWRRGLWYLHMHSTRGSTNVSVLRQVGTTILQSTLRQSLYEKSSSGAPSFLVYKCHSSPSWFFGTRAAAVQCRRPQYALDHTPVP